MRHDHRWRLLREFEDEQRNRTLKQLTEKKSLEIFDNLYQFSRAFVNKGYYKKLDLIKIRALATVHSRFAKAAE